ncbi:hypothetical protein Dsin_032539 [Dipteronia sinensis]|uniref:GRHL1/CP2 C-terminal domain-containing protein n=1 Tax=Dipteronia sinensis TaxID=43782 RepID=A0AAD9ZIP5_9ROSI|nr:hypothetical protein Dsin_032539 [Dipteronia sinensis]
MAKGGKLHADNAQSLPVTNTPSEAAKLSAEEDLHIKLMGLQDMFSSTRPVSILFLKGEPEDDPDLSPVKLPGGDEVKPVVRTATWESRLSGSESPSSNVSPTPTTGSLTPKRKFLELQQPAIAEEPEVEYHSDHDPSLSPGRPVKILKTEHDTSKADIFALDVDDSYQPPKTERPIKPVKDLINGIAEKFGVNPSRITQVFHFSTKGLRIIVDEDVVRELPEGQDMMVEFASARQENVQNLGYNVSSAAAQNIVVDADIAPGDMANAIPPDALEMWLNF